MFGYKEIRVILAVGIALILLVNLASYLNKDLTEGDFSFPHCSFENIDQECPVAYDADCVDGCEPAFFSILPNPDGSFLKEQVCPSLDMPLSSQEVLVLRC